MNSREHFLHILLSLPSVHEKGSVIPVSVEELAETLYCTQRNVKFILRKLVDEAFIEWRAGVGRGNTSQMTLLRELDEVIDDYFQEMLAKGKMKEAIQLVNRKNLPPPVRNKLHHLLENQFGLQVEQTESARLDVLRVPRSRKLATLDPAFVATSAEGYFLEQICNTLIAFDPKKKRFRPALAHTWESSGEGRKWTFYLRKGVRFHHGRTMTSKDVQYTLQRLRDVRSPARWQYDDIERIELVNDFTVTFHLKQPSAFFLHFFSCVHMSILPHDVPCSEKAIIGTGPFRIAQFTDQVFVLEAFEHYFRERALLDRVEMWQVPDDYSNLRHYELPYVDMQTDEDGPGGDMEYQEIGCRNLTFNFRKDGIQHNPMFRKAMKHIFDPIAIINELKGSRVAPANSFLPEKSKQFTYEEGSLEEAKTLLHACGYAGETLKLYYRNGGMGAEDGEWLKRRCDSVGLRISMHHLDLADYYSTEADREANFMLLGEVLEEDLEWGLLRLFKDEGTFLRRFLNSEQLAKLEECLRDFVQLHTEDERSRCIDQAEQIIREGDWLLFGYHVNRIARYHPSLQGLAVDSFGWIDFSKLWIKPAMFMLS